MVEEKQQGRAYWIGQVYVVDGRCWGIDQRHKLDKNGIGYLAVVNVRLGEEEDIAPILRGEMPLDTLPNDTDGYRKMILQRILEEEGIGEFSRRGLERNGSNGAIGHKKDNLRRSPTGARLPRGKSRQGKSLFG